jgi:hypothetical protein
MWGSPHSFKPQPVEPNAVGDVQALMADIAPKCLCLLTWDRPGCVMPRVAGY